MSGLRNSHISKGRILCTGEENFVGEKLAMELMEWDRIGVKVESSDDIMIFTADIAIDYRIEFSRGETSSS